MVAMVIMVATVMLVDVNMDRTGKDRTGQNWHLNLTFPVTCDWQLSQLLRSLYWWYSWYDGILSSIGNVGDGALLKTETSLQKQLPSQGKVVILSDKNSLFPKIFPNPDMITSKSDKASKVRYIYMTSAEKLLRTGNQKADFPKFIFWKEAEKAVSEIFGIWAKKTLWGHKEELTSEPF